MEAPRTLNYQALRDEFDGDDAFVGEILATFAKDLGLRLGELDEAVAEADADAIARVAHKLKGAALTVGADAIRETAAALEVAGRGNALDDVGVLRQQLAQAIDAALGYIEALP